MEQVRDEATRAQVAEAEALVEEGEHWRKEMHEILVNHKRESLMQATSGKFMDLASPCVLPALGSFLFMKLRPDGTNRRIVQTRETGQVHLHFVG